MHPFKESLTHCFVFFIFFFECLSKLLQMCITHSQLCREVFLIHLICLLSPLNLGQDLLLLNCKRLVCSIYLCFKELNGALVCWALLNKCLLFLDRVCFFLKKLLLCLFWSIG